MILHCHKLASISPLWAEGKLVQACNRLIITLGYTQKSLQIITYYTKKNKKKGKKQRGDCVAIRDLLGICLYKHKVLCSVLGLVMNHPST